MYKLNPDNPDNNENKHNDNKENKQEIPSIDWVRIIIGIIIMAGVLIVMKFVFNK